MLVDLDTVKREWSTATRAVRARLQSVAQRQVDALLSAGVIGAAVTRAQLETLLAVEVDAALSQLADEAPGVS